MPTAGMSGELRSLSSGTHLREEKSSREATYNNIMVTWIYFQK